MSATHLTQDNFEAEVLQANEPVLVDFFAEWCGPCKQIAPIIEAVAEKYAGKVKVCKADVDKAGAVAAQYGVQSIPTLIVFKNGKAVAKNIGFMPQDALEALIEENI